MVVLGIDPGSTVTGWGVVTLHRGRYVLLDSGAIRTRASEPIPLRLRAIHEGIADVLARTSPTAVAIEEIFAHKSSTSALRLGQARGVALLAVAQAGLEVHEYNPMTVKRSVGAHGKADKDAVARVVRMLLGHDVPGPADVSDAIAIAVTHCAHAGLHARAGAR